MNICFITYKYPGKHNTSEYVFVKQLVDAIASQGNHCSVLAPFNVFHYKRLPVTNEEYVIGKGNVTVIRPCFISFSKLKIGKFKLSLWAHKRAFKRAFKKLDTIPDVIYGHFWSAAYCGYELAKNNNIPLFVASGESEISKMFSRPSDVEEFAKYVSGVVCVSSKNRDESIKLGLTTFEKCGVFPNAVNVALFNKRDRGVCRRQLGLPQNDFIVAFVGWFNERKGSLRVAEAISRIGGVKSFFIGKGEQAPQCDGILFSGALPHDQVPLYLGAADCFVLPSLAEGCCNAVVEAMSCGLPVISSNLPFNWDVLDESNSIMIDPNDVEAIADAIVRLRDDNELREKMAASSLQKAASLTINRRAESIIRFIESKIQDQE